MRSASFLLYLVLAGPQGPAAPSSGPFDLRPEDLSRWRDHLRPSPQETAFERIPWIPELAEGLRRASSQGRPVLLWAMNGHPLGCT